MSAKEESQTKKFQKGERTVPSAGQRAKKYYPAEDEQKLKTVSYSQEQQTLRIA